MSSDNEKWNMPVGVQQVTGYPFGQWNGKKHKYAITVDVSELTDVTKPQAKMNLIVDGKVIKSATIEELLQGKLSI